MRILTGIQPSGVLHIGNYFGAIKPMIDLQGQGDVFLFLADLHALTSLHDGPAVREATRTAAVDLLACGLDPERTVFWRQSQVSYHTELMWILTTVTPMGLMERCVAYKDKVARGLGANTGLFTYPILQAADIMAYDADLVPVGKDQQQHLEVTRDIAVKINETFGEGTLKLPEARISEAVAVVPGLDGAKMSKSYGNTIEIFGPEKPLRKKIMSIVMDSRTPEEPKPDADQNVALQLLKFVAPADEAKAVGDRLRSGGFGYGDLKKALFEHYWNYFAEARRRRSELEQNLDYVNEVLREGAIKARAIAGPVVARAKRACGLD